MYALLQHRVSASIVENRVCALLENRPRACSLCTQMVCVPLKERLSAYFVRENTECIFCRTQTESLLF